MGQFNGDRFDEPDAAQRSERQWTSHESLPDYQHGRQQGLDHGDALVSAPASLSTHNFGGDAVAKVARLRQRMAAIRDPNRTVADDSDEGMSHAARHLDRSMAAVAARQHGRCAPHLHSNIKANVSRLATCVYRKHCRAKRQEAAWRSRQRRKVQRNEFHLAADPRCDLEARLPDAHES